MVLRARDSVIERPDDEMGMIVRAVGRHDPMVRRP